MKLLLAATLFSSMTMAHENSCSMQLNDDLHMNAAEVQLQRGDTTLWRINTQGQLWVQGQAVAVDTTTQQHLQQYQAGLRSTAKDTLVLVGDAMDLAGTAIGRVFEQFGVDDADQNSRLNKALANMKQNIQQVVYQQGDEIHLHGSKMDSIDQGFDTELSAAIEESMADITGNVLMMVGKAMVSGEGTFEERMKTFEHNMDQFGEQLEVEMEAKAEVLETRGQQLCGQLQQLDVLESQIQAQVPAMASFDLISIDKNSDSNFTLEF